MKGLLLGLIFVSFFVVGEEKQGSAYSVFVDCNDQDTTLCQKAKSGDPIAQLNLGELYDDGELADRDYSKARYWYELSANQGNATAQLYLGVLYASGVTGSVDYDKARSMWELAAKQDNAIAQYNLGQLYAEGRGVKQDDALTRNLFEKSCDNGFRPACDRLKQ
ncbi:tetratricopeptide repeat protein [Providencia hangzhouensis]|uniref:tetratricopeptide repeat protein n=1 Tax=Providencia hangzhouensis TaxID=3031799 RepID=UPI0034DDC22D